MCETWRQKLSAIDPPYFESDDESAISAFGYPKINHGWVECVSKSFPGQTYFFNVDSCCSTWQRPISRFIPTRISRPLNLLSDDDFLDQAPINVSDIEDENDYDEDDEYEETINLDLPPDYDDVKPPTITVNETKESKDAKIYADVLFKLYHCRSTDWNYNDVEDIAPLKCESLDDDSNENFEPILPETCYSSDSNGETSESTGSESASVSRKTNTLGTSEDHEKFVEVLREDDDQLSEINCLEVLQTDGSSENENHENPLNISISSAEDSDIGSRKIGSSSDSEEDDEEVNEETDDKYIFALPRLKAIEFADLERPRKIRKKVRKRKASNKNNETLNNNSSNKMIKIVREVNGITTVNYDYLEPNLPCGVKMSNLSDSESSGCYDTSYSQQNKISNNNSSNVLNNEATKNIDVLNEPMDFSEPNLSDSSSSSDSSVRAKRLKTLKILGFKKKSKSTEIQSSETFSSSSSSDSSWNNSDVSSDDND